MATVQSAYGRPEDKDIEKEFMKKIRGDKLQAINAECELEICLAFKHGNKQKPGKKSRGKNKDVEEGNQTLGSRIQLLTIGDSGKFNVDKREELEVQFKKLKEAWKFQEIQENKQLPDYFFDDGCDLSYIIYELQKDPNHTEMFSAEQLIFLEILCLDGRNHLSGAILDYYTKNMELMIDAMKNGLEKITKKLQELKIKNKSKSKDKKGQGDEGQSENLNSQNELAEIGSQNQEEDEDEQNQKKPKKTKGISKAAKKTEKGKKNKKNEDNEPSEEQEQNPDSDKELALKTINYITWAYWYVIPKQ